MTRQCPGAGFCCDYWRETGARHTQRPMTWAVPQGPPRDQADPGVRNGMSTLPVRHDSLAATPTEGIEDYCKSPGI